MFVCCFFFLFVEINCSKMIYRFITKIINMFIKGFMHTLFEHLSCSHSIMKIHQCRLQKQNKRTNPYNQWLVCTGLSCVQVVCPAVMLAGWNQFLRKQIRLSWFLVVNQVVVSLTLLFQITLVQACYWEEIYI